MNEYFIGVETVRVDFPDGQWVEVKSELTQEDQDIITNAMVKLKENRDMDLNIGRLILLERMVVSWSFPEPITRANLSRLRRKYRQPVLDRCDELNTAAWGYVTKNSGGASSEPLPSIS